MLCFTISFPCSTCGALITTFSHPWHCRYFILLSYYCIFFFFGYFTTSFVHSYYCISSDFRFQLYCCSPCEKVEFLLIFDLSVALLRPMRQLITCIGMRKVEFILISDFNVALLLPMRQQSTCSGTRGLSLWKSEFLIS